MFNDYQNYRSCSIEKINGHFPDQESGLVPIPVKYLNVWPHFFSICPEKPEWIENIL